MKGIVFIRPGGNDVKQHHAQVYQQHAQEDAVHPYGQPAARQEENQQREHHQYAGKHKAIIPHRYLAG